MRSVFGWRRRTELYLFQGAFYFGSVHIEDGPSAQFGQHGHNYDPSPPISYTR